MVIDASALVDVLLWPDRLEAMLRLVGREPELVAPATVDPEVLHALRRQVRLGALPVREAEIAVQSLAIAPVDRVPVHHLGPHIWELRENLSAYDATYLALARSLDCAVVTSDRRFAGSPVVAEGEVLVLPRS